MDTAWFDMTVAWIPGTLLGVAGGTFGGLLGLARMSKERSTRWFSPLRASYWIIVSVSALFLTLAVTAMFSQQPWAVWYALLQPGLPNWLKQKGFSDGMLHVAQTAAERAQADKFKSQVLSAYKQHGWRLAYAYVDSATDFRAYAEAGIPREHVFALKRAGSQECQDGLYQTCLGGWTEHLPYIESQVPGTK